ncbi:hypothetical protein VF12_39860 [Nostoc linckia z15]|nr:hypothetical protein VF12_39860 [Nostoc linckia z15]
MKNLKKNQALLTAITENAIDGTITINERGIVESVTSSACKLFLYSPNEVIGKNISALMPYPDKERHDGYVTIITPAGDKGHVLFLALPLILVNQLIMFN